MASPAATAATSDFELSDRQFDRIRELVREHTGISLSDAKRQLVYGRLVRRLRARQLPGFAPYIAIIESGDVTELEEFTNAVTTNLTAFFREEHHFDYLANTVLPAISARKATNRRVRVWCCAASTGEEPYSIAMTLHEQRALLHGMDVKFLATDIDSNVLATGAAGIYDDERLQTMSRARRSAYFQALGGGDAGKYRVNDVLREYITFKQLNLMNEWPMRGPFDVIFCRNVIIYFDKPTQRELFARMAALQRPGDILFLGHSESLYKVCDSYELIGRTIYRRVDR